MQGQWEAIGNPNLEEYVIQNRATCFNKNQVFHFCINQNCRIKDVFTCAIPECKCHDQHRECVKFSVQSYLNRIKLKIKDLTPESKRLLQQKFDKIIDQLSDLRQNIIKRMDEIKEQLKLSRLSQIQKLFLRIVQTNQNGDIFELPETKKLYQLDFQQNKSENGKFLDDLTKKIDTFIKQGTDLNTKMELDLKKMIQDFKNQQETFMANIKSQISQRLIQRRLLEKSSIIVDLKKAKDMLKLFYPLKPKDMNLLFKASQHNFQIKQFFSSSCARQTRTLLICQTNKGKIIGGYTPLSHKRTGKGIESYYSAGYLKTSEFGTDEKGEGFLFSLTQKDKFELRNKERAITRDQFSESIHFGHQGQLIICNNSNLNDSCESNINWKNAWNSGFDEQSSYWNKKYSGVTGLFGDQDHSMRRFNGNQNKYFTTKEWEVWKVFFDDNEDHKIAEQIQKPVIKQDDFGTLLNLTENDAVYLQFS